MYLHAYLGIAIYSEVQLCTCGVCHGVNKGCEGWWFLTLTPSYSVSYL